MYEDYLAHYGILGMKWGVRRYQPYSVRGRVSGKSGKEVGEAKQHAKRIAKIGAATAGAAAAGYGLYSVGKNADRNKLFAQTIKGGKDKPNVSPAEKMISETGKIAEKSGRIVKTVQKAKSVKNGRESKRLSDEELKKRIARLELEKRYEDLSAEDISRGRVTTGEILDSVGDALAIAGSVATIAAVYKLAKG